MDSPVDRTMSAGSPTHHGYRLICTDRESKCDKIKMAAVPFFQQVTDLMQAVYTYLTERNYPPASLHRNTNFKAIKQFVIHDGELFFQKQEKKARDDTKV